MGSPATASTASPQGASPLSTYRGVNGVELGTAGHIVRTNESSIKSWTIQVHSRATPQSFGGSLFILCMHCLTEQGHSSQGCPGQLVKCIEAAASREWAFQVNVLD